METGRGGGAAGDGGGRGRAFSMNVFSAEPVRVRVKAVTPFFFTHMHAAVISFHLSRESEINGFSPFTSVCRAFHCTK